MLNTFAQYGYSNAIYSRSVPDGKEYAGTSMDNMIEEYRSGPSDYIISFSRATKLPLGAAWNVGDLSGDINKLILPQILEV